MEQKGFEFKPQKRVLTEEERMDGANVYRVERTTQTGAFVPPYKCGADSLKNAEEKAREDGANSNFIVGKAKKITDYELQRLNSGPDPRLPDD